MNVNYSVQYQGHTAAISHKVLTAHIKAAELGNDAVWSFVSICRDVVFVGKCSKSYVEVFVDLVNDLLIRG